jgi:hypothetical protein
LILVTVRYVGPFTLHKALCFRQPGQPVKEVPDEQGFFIAVPWAAVVEYRFAGGKGKHGTAARVPLRYVVICFCSIFGLND